ncbi:MAG: hypothetical protein P8Y03_02210 [Anaerolineales bacterium]
MQKLPKKIRRQITDLEGIAYERELENELHKLAAHFDAWKAKRIDPWELTELIHKFHNGPARELYKQYTDGYHEMNIAYAIKTGILKENEIPDEVWPHLEGPLDFYRDSDEESNNKSFSDT